MSPCGTDNILQPPTITGLPASGYSIDLDDSLSVEINVPNSSYDDSTNYLCGPRSYSIDSISPPTPDIAASSSVVVSTINPRGELLIAPLTLSETNIQFTVTIKVTLIDFPTVSSTLDVAIEFVAPCGTDNILQPPSITGLPSSGYRVELNDSLTAEINVPDYSYGDSINYICGPRSFSIDSISPSTPDIAASSSVVVTTINPRGQIYIAPLSFVETNI